MSPDAPAEAPFRRRTRDRIVAVVAAPVVAPLILLALQGCSSPDAAPLPAGSTSASVPGTSPGASTATPSASGAATADPSTGASDQPSASAPASGPATVVPTEATKTSTVPLDKKADLGRGVVATVAKVESVKGQAKGPGEIAGPAVRVTVRVANGSSKRLDMQLALVNLYYGKDKAPASSLSGPGASPLSAPIPPGKTDSGRYVFSVPSNERDTLSVEFSYTTDAPTVIFKGTP